jgi:hypothetical protein
MASVRKFALIFGILYVLGGIAGFIPALLQPMAPTAPQLAVDSLSGQVLGLFPVNILHSLVHLAIGVWGLIAAKSIGASINYGRGVAIFYGLLAIMGFIPGLQTMFGLVPLHGHDIWLHAGSALIAAYFGFAYKPETARHRA